MPFLVSTVFAKSAILPNHSPERAIKSIESQIAKRNFQDFNEIIIDDKNEQEFEHHLIEAMLTAQAYIYDKHCNQASFIKHNITTKKIGPSYDLDLASKDENEQPYVVIYKSSGSQFHLYAAMGCGSHGRSFDPNKGIQHQRLIIKDDQSHSWLTQQKLALVIAKILPERDCDGHDIEEARSYKKYSEYELPIAIYNAQKKQYQTAIGEYQGYGCGYIIKIMDQTLYETIEHGPTPDFSPLEEHEFDWEDEKELELLTAATHKPVKGLMKDLFPHEKNAPTVTTRHQNFICPLTNTIMRDPVIVLGPLRSEFPWVYEREALEAEFDENGFDKSTIESNRSLKRAIDDFQMQADHKELTHKKR